jgi:hypothetical protein
MAILAGGRAGHFHGVAGLAHPVGDILAEVGYVPRSDLFPVTLPAVAFHVALVGSVWKGDSIFELEYRRAFICKRGSCYEKNCRY